MTDFHLTRALLPGGWAEDVVVRVEDGRITRVSSGADRGGAGGGGEDAARGSGEVDSAGGHEDARGARAHPGGASERDRREASDVAGRVGLGTVVPGVVNAHSHAFQRGMAGLAERRGEGPDSFWSWRTVMYAFLEELTPDDVEAIAALAYCEMLESGFTGVGEFHYLHHAPDGSRYDDPAEMAGRIAAAALRTGIVPTLLPVFYAHADFDRAPPTPRQRRFASGLDDFAELLGGARRHLAPLAHARTGVAPHSLRAATVEEIAALLPLTDGPVHIHVAEQTAEVDGSLAVHGARPVAHLLDRCPVDARWCLIHATHMDADETARAAATGAVAGLCPITEANLGDGLFPALPWLEAGGRIAVGSDSHVRIDLAEELRTLEYGRRLVDRRRNVLARPGESTGRRLFELVADGGARATGQTTGRIEVGARADFVVLAEDDPVLTGREADARIDAWIFAGDGRQVDEVWVAGRRVVAGGRAGARDEVDDAWRRRERALRQRGVG